LMVLCPCRRPNARGGTSICSRCLSESLDSCSEVIVSDTCWGSSSVVVSWSFEDPFSWDGLPAKCSAIRVSGASSPQAGQDSMVVCGTTDELDESRTVLIAIVLVLAGLVQCVLGLTCRVFACLGRVPDLEAASLTLRNVPGCSVLLPVRLTISNPEIVPATAPIRNSIIVVSISQCS
jgi:hypothetical protein